MTPDKKFRETNNFEYILTGLQMSLGLSQIIYPLEINSPIIFKMNCLVYKMS